MKDYTNELLIFGYKKTTQAINRQGICQLININSYCETLFNGLWSFSGVNTLVIYFDKALHCHFERVTISDLV